jgi:hypothetical protein
MHTTLTLLDFIFIAALVWIMTRRSYLESAGGASEQLRTRRQVDAIMKHLGLPEPSMSSADKLSPEVIEFLADGRTIDAIRLYRQETGQNLKQARDAIGRHPGAASPSH